MGKDDLKESVANHGESAAQGNHRCLYFTIVLLKLLQKSNCVTRIGPHEANFLLDCLFGAVGVRDGLRLAAFRTQFRSARFALFAGKCGSNPDDERHLCVEANERSVSDTALGRFLHRLSLFTKSATGVIRVESVAA
jgi:hypothetical protein